MLKHDLVAARLCYNEALNYLVPNFESTKNVLLDMEIDVYLSNKMDLLLSEIAMIFGNRSTVMLKQGDPNKAICDAELSLGYLPTAKVDKYIASDYY